MTLEGRIDELEERVKSLEEHDVFAIREKALRQWFLEKIKKIYKESFQAINNSDRALMERLIWELEK